MKIRSRLYLSAAVSIILVLILGVITFVTSNTVEEKRQVHEIAHHMQDAISELDTLTFEYLLSSDSSIEKEWFTKYHSTASSVGEELALSVRADYAVYGDLFTQLTSNSKKITRLIQEGAQQEELSDALALEDAIIPQLMAKSREIMDKAHEISAKSFDEMIATQEQSRNITLGLVIVSAVLITIISVIIARSISGVLDRLNDFSRRISEGENLLHEEVDGTHEITRMASDVRDVVDRLSRMQGELFRSERMATLGQFSGNISHELRNPLGVIDSSVYFLKMKLKDADEKTIEHLDRIKHAVDNSSAIIESLLNLTRMKSPDLSHIDLKMVVEDAVTTSKLPKTVSTEFVFPDGAVLVNGDHEQLRMALKNIIKNANEAMDGEGTLKLTISTSDNGRAEISIKDSGTGIAPDDLDRVFQPLFTRKVKGIGFGLSITQMVIEKHEGSVFVTSEPGEGAEFIIRLPVV